MVSVCITNFHVYNNGQTLDFRVDRSLLKSVIQNKVSTKCSLTLLTDSVTKSNIRKQNIDITKRQIGSLSMSNVFNIVIYTYIYHLKINNLKSEKFSFSNLLSGLIHIYIVSCEKVATILGKKF